VPDLKDPSLRLGVLIRGLPLGYVLGIGHHLRDVLTSLTLRLHWRNGLTLRLDLYQISVAVGHAYL